MSHQIRTSERRSFRSCRRRWDWVYRQGYAPVEEAKALEFGRAFHSAMEEIYNPETWFLTTAHDKLRLAKQVFELECEKQRKQYLKDTGLIRLDREGQDDYNERIKLGHGMLEYYVFNVHAKQDHWLKPVKVEIEFDVPVTDEYGYTLHCFNSPQCGQIHSNVIDVDYDGNVIDNNFVTHGGRVDCLVEDIIHGGYWVFDWKTAAELRATEELLELDDQLNTYLWALRDKLQIDIRGFVYVEIRKAYPQPPKELKRPRNGCSFSTDKRQPTIPELFIKTIQEEDYDAWNSGYYDEFIHWLRTDKDAAKFHQRFEIRKTPLELINVGLNIAEEAADMIDSNLRMYPSTGRFSCPSCAFKSPCRMKFEGSDYVYTLDTMFRKIK
jgi:hypothetical protein